jgi:hypothetical protein
MAASCFGPRHAARVPRLRARLCPHAPVPGEP